MESVYTIVVPDSEILSGVCGTNDSNLRLIEEHLGTLVFTRGNELSLGEANPQVHKRFEQIIQRIMEQISEGGIADDYLVSSILNCENLDVDTTDIVKNTTVFKKNFNDSSIKIAGAKSVVYPKTLGQASLVQALRAYDMVFCVGPAGTGKTYLMVAEALNLLAQHKISKVILTRPVVEAGESLGFLPGDLEQKLHPYLRPLYDAMEGLLPQAVLKKILDNNLVEIAPLAYMRGRTLSNSVIILDEAQNTTVRQMRMFLTRMGEGSKIFVTGDTTQTDLPSRIESGLKHALHILKDIEDIKSVYMDSSDVVRHGLVKKIIRAYEEYE